MSAVKCGTQLVWSVNIVVVTDSKFIVVKDKIVDFFVADILGHIVACR